MQQTRKGFPQQEQFPSIRFSCKKLRGRELLFNYLLCIYFLCQAERLLVHTDKNVRCCYNEEKIEVTTTTGLSVIQHKIDSLIKLFLSFFH